MFVFVTRFIVVFFFKQKTAYEMRISDWSSDVCSSDLVIHVPLTLWQRAALISFTYNVGQSNLKSSTLAKEFNQKQYEAGCNELLRWVYAGKKKLKGLEKRREMERDMCIGKMEWSNGTNEKNIMGWWFNLTKYNTEEDRREKRGVGKEGE